MISILIETLTGTSPGLTFGGLLGTIGVLYALSTKLWNDRVKREQEIGDAEREGREEAEKQAREDRALLTTTLTEIARTQQIIEANQSTMAANLYRLTEHFIGGTPPPTPPRRRLATGSD